MAVHPTRDLVVLTVAVGLATALNVVTFAVLYDAIRSQGPGLSDNAVQLLTGWGGGMIGIIGAYVGARVATETSQRGSTMSETPNDGGERDEVVEVVEEKIEEHRETGHGHVDEPVDRDDGDDGETEDGELVEGDDDEPESDEATNPPE